jgi:hypothetical protein
MAVETVSTMIGYDLRDHRWVAFCPHYDLDAHDTTIESSWDRLVDLCNGWVEWCLLQGLPELSETHAPYLNVIEESIKEPYATVELAGLSIEMTGWLILDRLPGNWQQGRILDA